MKLKVFEFPSQPKHKGFVGCVAWNSNNELISCGDDHKVFLFKAEENLIHDPGNLSSVSIITGKKYRSSKIIPNINVRVFPIIAPPPSFVVL